MSLLDEIRNNEGIDVDMPLFEPLTEEELKKRKDEEAKELEVRGFLPKNDDYNETMTSPQEEVENNPTRFIIEECLPACRELWGKNIYTFMVSDHVNVGVCWIEIIASNLSEENLKIYEELDDNEVIKFSYHNGTINFGVNAVGKDGQAKLLEIAKRFKMQDVPKDAYMLPEEFLVNKCGCYEEYDNPDYYEKEAPYDLDLTAQDYVRAIDEYDDYLASIHSHKTLKRFDPSKMTKSIEEYAKEHGMIYEDGRVYLSEFHYKKHQNYVAINSHDVAPGR
jgi:hypothetical protein